MNESIAGAAEFLAELRFSKKQEENIPEQWRPRDLESGYAIQAALLEKLVANRGGSHVGYKVACTNKLAQELLKVKSPFYGFLYSSWVHPSPAHLNHRDFSMRCIEAEFSFAMARDLPPRGTEYSKDEVASAVAAILPAIEIVDTRYTEWTKVGAAALIADNAANGAWVQGPHSTTDWKKLDLASHSVKLIVNGETKLWGSGAEVLGNPLNSLVWLANELREKGMGLKAGNRITTGVCTDVYFAEPGDHIVADFGEIGQAELSFSL
ncbi:MAG: fumarylacetoacetate hydrolase family protein [SAR324 cluster bacterium]|nr:fumarylacetoacetate hydrolase family protein [SAR324 cluster bacterium]